MKKFFRSFTYAFNGIRTSFADQLNLKVHFMIALLVIAAGFYFGISRSDWCVIVLTIALVIALEMMNSAIESVVDLVTTERKPLAGKVKDIAAGAVLFASVMSVIIGVIIFSKYIST
jgi:diacylglycerol kinase